MSRCLEAFNARSTLARKTDLSMAEALNDPLIQTLMDADGVDRDAIADEWTQIADAREATLET